jgi:hypothetical protein
LIQDTSKIKKGNFKYYDLIIGNKKSKWFNDFKTTTRAYFFQYDKYKKLYEKYNDGVFLEIKEILLKKYIDEDQKMKKCNPILYFFRKQKDKKKGKRQLKINKITSC